jgi:protein-tyrosine phosphatase
MTDFHAHDLADIHNHLCPGVDDGARTLDESLRHLRLLRADGVTRLATSSHLQGWLAYEENGIEERLRRIEEAWRELEQACRGQGDVPALRFNQEILVPNPDVAELVFAVDGVGLRGTSYALIEFGFDPEGDLRDVVRAVRSAGRRPIVAHPERYRHQGGLMPPEIIRGWREAGALLQVNCGSVLGDYGREIRDLAWRLLADGVVDLLGTDHHADNRQVSPRRAGELLARRGAAEQARLLLVENPNHVLDDEETVSVPAWRAQAAA